MLIIKVKEQINMIRNHILEVLLLLPPRPPPPPPHLLQIRIIEANIINQVVVNTVTNITKVVEVIEVEVDINLIINIDIRIF